MLKSRSYRLTHVGFERTASALEGVPGLDIFTPGLHTSRLIRSQKPNSFNDLQKHCLISILSRSTSHLSDHQRISDGAEKPRFRRHFQISRPIGRDDPRAATRQTVGPPGACLWRAISDFPSIRAARGRRRVRLGVRRVRDGLWAFLALADSRNVCSQAI